MKITSFQVRGVQGYGIVFTYTPAALKPMAELIRNLEPLVAGQTLQKYLA
jgi:mandelate racemase